MDLSQILTELGEERAGYFNAVAPPLVQTSNFAFSSVADLRRAFADEMGGYLYSRGLNPTTDILRRKLAALDGAEDALVFANGAAAIYAGVMPHVKTGDHIISVLQPYTWAQKTFDEILPRYGVTTTYVDGTEIGQFEAALQPNTRFIYLESPNSWSFAVQPLAEVAALAKSRGMVTMIDNSYCSPLYQRPWELGIDLCMQTATKYIGGHSDTLGGVLTGSAGRIRRIFELDYLAIGSAIAPFNAWLLLRGLRTLPARLERISRTTTAVIAFLKSHPKVSSVRYPLDPDFPQFALASSQMSGAGGLLTFSIKDGNPERITRLCESLQHLLMAVSWGGYESLILPKCAGIEPKDFDPSNEQHQWIRLYCGLEDPEYIIADLTRGLDAA